jgi:hypothetical protein
MSVRERDLHIAVLRAEREREELLVIINEIGKWVDGSGGSSLIDLRLNLSLSPARNAEMTTKRQSEREHEMAQAK